MNRIRVVRTFPIGTDEEDPAVRIGRRDRLILPLARWGLKGFE